jgi:hypothetical protein
VRGSKRDGTRVALGLAEGDGDRLRVGVCVRFRQTAGGPGKFAASVAQFTIEKLATVALCEKLSKWHSENVIEQDAGSPFARIGAEFPAIALSEIVTVA